MKSKIIEYVVKAQDEFLDGSGVDIMSLVGDPAIKLDFLAFADEPLNLWGYVPVHFDMCPMATALFTHLVEDMNPDEDTQGMIRSAALGLDTIFGIKKESLERGGIRDEDLLGVLTLATDFVDLMQEIDNALGMNHDLDFLGDHLKVLIDLHGDSESFLEENPCQPGWIAYGLKEKDGRLVPNCVPLSAEGFASYNDYPQSATAAAKRALEWRDKNPDQGCGTRVGWARANQLAKRESISEETIARMASFARHLQYKDVPYSEGCGGLMVDAWGGPAGIQWAQSKLKRIRESMSVDTTGLPPYVDEGLTPKEKEILALFERIGEEIPGDAQFIDASKDQFNTVTDIIAGLTALDILGRRGITQEDEEGVTVYRYAGPTAQRGFCRAMLRLNKVYRQDEIDLLNSENPGMGRNGSDTYDVFDYKGGVNCRHYWEMLQMFKSGRSTVFVSEGPASGLSGQSNNEDEPSAAGSVANNASLKFSEEGDQRIVIGPAMIPDKLIRRIDKKTGAPFHVYFSEKTIRDIAEGFLANHYQNNTNVEHQEKTTNTKNTLLESWLVQNSELDKSRVYGFDLPVGTWMVSYKINDEETWKKIKSGELRGFSVEGHFVNKAELM